MSSYDLTERDLNPPILSPRKANRDDIKKAWEIRPKVIPKTLTADGKGHYFTNDTDKEFGIQTIIECRYCEFRFVERGIVIPLSFPKGHLRSNGECPFKDLPVNTYVWNVY